MSKGAFPLEILATLVCDDIRREQNGKDILIGVYGGDILVERFPAPLPLAIYVQLAPKVTGPIALEFRLVMDGRQTLAEGALHLNIDSLGPPAALPLNGVLALVPQPGTLGIQIRAPGSGWKTLRTISIRQGGPPGAAAPPPP
ncbi:hypothetical protein [Synechococcus phage MinM1]|nr:hypothetical protein [Synechococcus phage MinM1]